jgi:hypothetical protein
MRLLLIISLLIILSAGCSSLKPMSPKEYLNWYAAKDFGWKGMDTIQDITCAIRLFPKEVTIAMCAIQNCETKEVLTERLSSKDETYDFMIEFSSLKPNTSIFDVPGSGAYSKSDKVLYLSNGIKKDIKGITVAGDTVSCQNVLYEPSIPQKARLLVTLENTKKNINQFIITDHMVSGEMIRFHIPELTHKSLPTLKL